MSQPSGYASYNYLFAHILFEVSLRPVPVRIQEHQAVLAPLSEELVGLDHKPSRLQPWVSSYKLLKIRIWTYQGEIAFIGEFIEVLGKVFGQQSFCIVFPNASLCHVQNHLRRPNVFLIYKPF